MNTEENSQEEEQSKNLPVQKNSQELSELSVRDKTLLDLKMNKYDPSRGVSIFDLAEVKVTPEEVVTNWLGGKSDTTLASYQSDLIQFAKWSNEDSPQRAALRLLQVSQERAMTILTAYKNYMMEKVVAPDGTKVSRFTPGTINRRLSSLRSLLRMARAAGVISYNIELSNVKSELRRETRSPGLAKAVDMMTYWFKQGRSGYRDAVGLFLMLRHGFRRQEIYLAHLNDWDEQLGVLKISAKGKTEKSSLTLLPDCQANIKEWISDWRGSTPGALFCSFHRAHEYKFMSLTSVNRIYKETGEKLDIYPCNPHSVGRHTFGTNAAKYLSPMDLMRVMRHANLNTTQKYIDSLKDGQFDVAEKIAQELQLPNLTQPKEEADGTKLEQDAPRARDSEEEKEIQEFGTDQA